MRPSSAQRLASTTDVVCARCRLQHDTRIFNVGNRRRLAAGVVDSPAKAANGHPQPVQGTGLLSSSFAALDIDSTAPARSTHGRAPSTGDIAGGMDQSAEFFDPNNTAASELREQVALETLDELLQYILYEGGSVGILDATNSTLKRRKAVLDRIRQVAGKEIGVVFLESECNDEMLLDANMRLKLQGPDYKDSDPVQALADFKRRGKLRRCMCLSVFRSLGY